MENINVEETQPKNSKEVDLDTDGIKEQDVQVKEEQKKEEPPKLNVGEVDLGYRIDNNTIISDITMIDIYAVSSTFPYKPNLCLYVRICGSDIDNNRALNILNQKSNDFKITFAKSRLTDNNIIIHPKHIKLHTINVNIDRIVINITPGLLLLAMVTINPPIINTLNIIVLATTIFLFAIL